MTGFATRLRAALAAACVMLAGPLAAERLQGLQIGTGAALTIAVLHGDQSSGGDPNYINWLGAELGKRLPGATVHMLLRPGYADPWGRVSPGENFDRRDQYTKEAATLIADTLEALKSDAPLLVVAHSGGAAQTALALSLGRGVVDEAILVGCPCDLDLWRAAHPNWPAFVRSVSAVDVSPKTEARVTVIVGADDTVTPPALSRSYVNHLKAAGAEARLVVVPGGDHVGNRALSSAWLQNVLDAAGRLGQR